MSTKDTPAMAKQDQAGLEEKAFAIFKELSLSRRGFKPEETALEAYKLAHAFSAVSAKVAAGDVSVLPEGPDVRPMVEFQHMIAKSDGTGFEAVLDPVTGEPVMRKAPADPYAFAPNCPVDHPANVRFLPRDGVKLADRIAAHKKALNN